MHHQITIVGRCGCDTEMSYLQDGTPVANVSIAVDDGFGDNKKTMWFRVTTWRKLAETMNTHVKKGMLILFTGRLTSGPEGGPRMWEDKQGITHAAWEMDAPVMKILEWNKDADSDSDTPSSAPARTAPAGLGAPPAR